MRLKMREMEEKMRKKFYRQAQKGICIATLSATVLTSIPTVSYAEAYAKGRAQLWKKCRSFPCLQKTQ